MNKPSEPNSTTPEVLKRYGERSLLERAVMFARPRRKRGTVPRWVVVQEVFALGSTFAVQLCREFGLDPDEEIR